MGYIVYQNPKNGRMVKIKRGFNIFAFLFGPVWFIFNGLPLWGLLWLLIALIVGYPTLAIGSFITWVIAGYKANGLKEKRLRRKGWLPV